MVLALAMGLLVPAALTGLSALKLPLPWAAALGLAVGLGYVAGPPGPLELALWEITDWSWLALGFGLLLSHQRGMWLAVPGWALLALGALRPLVIYQWSWGETLLWLSLAALVPAAGAFCARASPQALILLGPWSLGVALSLAATGSLLLGQLALVPAAVIAAALWPAQKQPAGLLVPLTVSQLCVLGGLAYASTPLWLGALLLALPLALALK